MSHRHTLTASPSHPATRLPHLQFALPLLIASLFFTGATPVQADVSLSQLREFTIRIAARPHPAEDHAARELQALLEPVLGKILSIEKHPVNAPLPPNSIGIGAASSLDVAHLGEEDFSLQIKTSRIEIRGGSPRGTLYAVHSFLEDNFGVRFLTVDHTHTPRADDSFVLRDQSRTFRPVFSWRYSYYSAVRENPEFATRLRNNAVTTRTELGGRNFWNLIGHSVDRWVPVAKFGLTNPEYFSLVDGRRRSFMKDDHFEKGGNQPCFSNPAVKQLIINGLLTDLAEKQQTTGSIALGQNDNQMYCRCPECSRIDEAETTHMGSLIHLVNDAARGIAQKTPEVSVGTLAYQFSRKPPAKAKLEKNVAIQLCSIEACLLHPLDDPNCKQNVAFVEDLQGWTALTPQLYIWNYNVNFANYNAPCPNLHVIASNLRLFARHHVRGVFMQCAGNARNTELCDLRNYLISKLLWDPARDPNLLIDEFLHLHYGAAAPHIREYLNLIESVGRNSGIHNDCYGLAADYGITPYVANKAIQILEAGEAVAENETVRRRVRKLLVSPYAALIDPFAKWLAGHFVELRDGKLKSVPPEAYASVASELKTFLSLCREFQVDHVTEWTTTEQFSALLPEEFRK